MQPFSANIGFAILSTLAIATHLVLRWRWDFDSSITNAPLLFVLAVAGLPMVIGLLRQAWRREFGADLLAGISIVTSLLLGEYLAGVLVVLMLSGGEALEEFAVKSASSVLDALARRMPSVAHRLINGQLHDVALAELQVNDELVVLPHEICPVDGVVVSGHSSMDESYLTGEPYRLSKAPGSAVLSGSVNGQEALTIRAERLASDSRYSKIMQVMRESEQRRPQLRRLGDRLGAIYTPLAVAVAVAAWLISGEVHRFLAVLVVATPCPLLIAIPVAVIGSISLAARRGIIVKDPAILESIDRCRIALFDKTGTLTYGEPALIEVDTVAPFERDRMLALAASAERYSRHPLAAAVVKAAKQANLALIEAEQLSEKPGEGLLGIVDDRRIQITSRSKLTGPLAVAIQQLPVLTSGMECVVVIDDQLAGRLLFRDEPRADGHRFISHLQGIHHFDRVVLISGDREAEVRTLAEQVGIKEVHFSQSPEQKLDLVRQLTAQGPSVFLGDGVNDAPALTAATVGIAFGQASDITSEAADAVILDTSLQRVDELLHIGRRMRSIALQSAVGGMLLSLIGMGFAAVGWLTPVHGALLQEAIDLVAVANALRVALPTAELSDL